MFAGFCTAKNKVNDIVFWSRVSPKNWCYRGSLSPCSTHPDTEPILLSLPDTKEFLHTAMAFSEILRIRLSIYAKIMLSWVSWFCSQRFIHSSTRLAARNGKEPLLFLVAHSGSCRSPGPHMVDHRMVNPAQAPCRSFQIDPNGFLFSFDECTGRNSWLELNRMRTPSPAVPWNGKCKDCVLQQQSLQFLTQQKHCRSFQIDPNGFLFSFDECTGRSSWLELCVFTCFHFDWLFWEKVRRYIFSAISRNAVFLVCSCSAVGCNCCSPCLLA